MSLMIYIPTPHKNYRSTFQDQKNNKCVIFQKYVLISIPSPTQIFPNVVWNFSPGEPFHQQTYTKASNLFIRRFWRSKTHLSQTTHTLGTPEEKRDPGWSAKANTTCLCIVLKPGHEVPLKELIPIFDANLKMDLFKNYLNILEPQVYWMSYLR